MNAVAMTNLCYTTAAELLALYRMRSLSPVEVIGAVLDRIEALNLRLNAYLHIDREYSLRQARAAEAAYLAGSAAPLAGVPVSIKDLVNVRGMPTTFGSLLYGGFMPEEDAYSVARLRSAGAVFSGKTNTPEFGSLPTNENRLGDSARNPWELSHTPGGSSGGAGAAVAAGLAPIGLGTDFGGSVRIPAAMCGVFGFKPTLGRIARDTSFNLTGEFFSHEGPLARTVLDGALFLDVCAGPDPRDRFSQIGAPPSFAAALESLPRGLRVAWTPDLGFAATDREYREVCERAVRAFATVTGEIEQDSPEGARAGLDGWRIAGAAGNYSAERAAKQKQDSELLTEAVRRSINMPEQTTLAQYFDAIAAVRTWRSSLASFFERYDLLLTPALITSDVLVGARELRINGESQPNTFGLINFTAPFNASGTPVAVVPCGFTNAGLPVALQIAGKFGADLLVMQASRAFEQLLPWAGKRPPLGDT